MGQSQIQEKLSNKLKSPLSIEEDVVYVLSKTRKILEIKNHPEKYQILNFYCNLALHTEISKRLPKKVGEMFERIRSGGDAEAYKNSLVNFSDFHQQFEEFLLENSLPNIYQANKIKVIQSLNQILVDIYSDTPIIIEYGKFEIRIDSDGIISGNSI